MTNATNFTSLTDTFQDSTQKLAVAHKRTVVLCDPPPAEKCAALEMQAWVAAHDLRPPPSTSHGSQIQRELNNHLAGSQDGVRALVAFNSTFTIDEDERPITLKDLPRGNQSKKWPQAALDLFLDEMIALTNNGSVPEYEKLVLRLNNLNAKPAQFLKGDLTQKWNSFKNKAKKAEQSGYRYRTPVRKPPTDNLHACKVLGVIRHKELENYTKHLQNIFHTAEYLSRQQGCDFLGWEQYKNKLLKDRKEAPAMRYIAMVAHQNYHVANWLFYYRLELDAAECKRAGLLMKVVNKFMERLPPGNPGYPRATEMTRRKHHTHRTVREEKLRDALWQVVFNDSPLRRICASEAFAGFASMIAAHSYGGERLICGICNQVRSQPCELFFLGKCGHTACITCLHWKTTCPLCRDGPHPESNIFQGSEFEVRDERKRASHPIYGQKIEDVVNLIDLKIPPLDQVLCFTDGPHATARLLLRLKARGISATNLSAEGRNSSKALQDFLGNRVKPKSARNWEALGTRNPNETLATATDEFADDEAAAAAHRAVRLTMVKGAQQDKNYTRKPPEPDLEIDKNFQSRVLILNIDDETAAGR